MNIKVMPISKTDGKVRITFDNDEDAFTFFVELNKKQVYDLADVLMGIAVINGK